MEELDVGVEVAESWIVRDGVVDEIGNVSRIGNAVVRS